MRIFFVGQNILGGLTLHALLRAEIKVDMVITRPKNDYQNLVQEVANRFDLVTFESSNLNADCIVEKYYEATKPDLGICCSWGHLIKEPLLNFPTLGWINLYPSYLPEYRGPRPIEWQIFHGKTTIGCTVHFMVQKFDEGNIIFQTRVPISSDDNRESAQRKSGRELGKLAVKAAELLKNNPQFQGTIQNECSATYAPHRSELRNIRLDMPAKSIINQIRSLSPFPLCITEYRGRSIPIVAASIVDLRTKLGSDPVFIGPDNKLWLSASDFFVRVESVKHNEKVYTEYQFLLESL